MRRQVILLLSIVASSLLYSMPTKPEKSLANPFGGQPPEFGPDQDENGNYANYINWRGSSGNMKYYLSWHAFNNNGYLFDNNKPHRGFFHTYLDRKKTTCMFNVAINPLDSQGFFVAVIDGSCWKYRQKDDLTTYKNIGGAMTDSHACRYSNSERTIIKCSSKDIYTLRRE